MECAWIWELLALLFLSPTPMQDLVDEGCFLDVEMSLWQMVQYPERENAVWTYRRLPRGMERRKVRWGKANDSFIQISFQVNTIWQSDDWAQLHSCMVTLFTSSLSNLLVTSEGKVREGESRGTAGTQYHVAWENLWCYASCWVVKTVNSEINTFVHKAWFCENPGLEDSKRSLVQMSKHSKIVNFHLQHWLFSHKETWWQAWHCWQAQEEVLSCMGSIYRPYFLHSNNCGRAWF